MAVKLLYAFREFKVAKRSCVMSVNSYGEEFLALASTSVTEGFLVYLPVKGKEDFITKLLDGYEFNEKGKFCYFYLTFFYLLLY